MEVQIYTNLRVNSLAIVPLAVKDDITLVIHHITHRDHAIDIKRPVQAPCHFLDLNGEDLESWLHADECAIQVP
jgi:hypothetical protein